MAFSETTDAVDRPASIDQLRQLRNRLREQHQIEVADADDAELTARRRREQAVETGKIIEGMTTLEEALVQVAKESGEVKENAAHWMSRHP